MKRTLLLGILLVGIVILIAVFVLRESREGRDAENYEGNFAIESIDGIGKIILSHRAAESYTLTREGDGWKVNNAYKVRMSSMKPLLDAIQLVQIRYIPAESAVPNIMENIEGTWIRAKIFDRNGELLKSYRVGGVSPDERGTYMIMDGSKQPFVVHIPSWDGALRTRYALRHDDWRDRHFMNISPEEIKTVSVEYPQQKSQSFRIARDGQHYIVSPLYPDLRDYSTTYRQGTAESYLNALVNAACEGYENQYVLKDSIRALIPFCQLQIELKGDNKPVSVRIWPKGAPVYTVNAPPVHRLFVDRIPGDFVLVQYDVIKGMLRGYDFFTGGETNLVF